MFLFRNFYTNVALLLFCLYSATNAVELRSLVQFEFPAQIGIDKKMNDVKEEREWDTDHVLMGGNKSCIGRASKSDHKRSVGSFL